MRKEYNANDADADADAEVSYNLSGFRKPIQSLLEDCYDPMYDYQMSERKSEILFHGNMQEFVKWAEDYTGTTMKIYVIIELLLLSFLHYSFLNFAAKIQFGYGLKV